MKNTKRAIKGNRQLVSAVRCGLLGVGMGIAPPLVNHTPYTASSLLVTVLCACAGIVVGVLMYPNEGPIQKENPFFDNPTRLTCFLTSGFLTIAGGGAGIVLVLSALRGLSKGVSIIDWLGLHPALYVLVVVTALCFYGTWNWARKGADLSPA